jgi:hypothetical protein
MSTANPRSKQSFGLQWKKNKYKPFHSSADEEAVLTKILKVAALTALFFLLAYFLPIAHSKAQDYELDSAGFPLLPYERSDAVTANPSKLAGIRTTPQNRDYDEMDKKDRQAEMAQLAISALGGAVYSPLGNVLNAIQQPIKSKNVGCRTRLSLNTYFLKCSLKF